MRKLFAVDLYVVASIDGKTFVEQNSLNAGSERILFTQPKQFRTQQLAFLF